MSLINRKSYLAEMRSLLAFMDPEARTRVLHHFDAMFDEAGPDGEETLARCLGSPVRQVLQIEREYREAREKGEEFYPETAVPAPMSAPAPASLTEEAQPSFEEVFPSPEESAVLPDASGETASDPEKTPAAEEGASAKLENALVAVFEQEPEELHPGEGVPASEPAAAPSMEEKVTVPAENRPSAGEPVNETEAEPEEGEEDEDDGPGAGRVIAAVLVTIPMLVIWAAMLAVFLALGMAILSAGLGIGAAGVYLGGYVFSGVITFMPDIMLVAGIALICFCLALLLAWMGLWIAAGGILLIVRFARSVYRGILGKRKGEKGDE